MSTAVSIVFSNTATERRRCRCWALYVTSSYYYVYGDSVATVLANVPAVRHAQHRFFPAGDPAAATWAHRNAAVRFDLASPGKSLCTFPARCCPLSWGERDLRCGRRLYSVSSSAVTSAVTFPGATRQPWLSLQVKYLCP